MLTAYPLLFEEFVATESQHTLHLLLEHAPSAKPFIDSYDFAVKDTILQRSRLKTLPRTYLRRLFLQQVAIALFYKKAGFLEEAAYSYDRSAQLSQGFATRSQGDEYSQWTQRKLCLRLAAANLFEKIHREEDSSYSYLYAAEAAEDLGDDTLCRRYAHKGSVYFKKTHSRPKNKTLNKFFEDYSS